MSRDFIKVLGLFVAVVFGMAGCGGGEGGSGTPAPITPGNVPASTVSGTASEGALITGKTVKLKDSNGMSAMDGTTNATTGIYSIDVTGLTAPFLVTVTGTNGTYVSLAQSAGTANINPITTTVVALAAGTLDMSALFTSLTPVQLFTISTNYTAKSALVSTSLQAALPAGVKAEDYFTGTITAGKGMDSVFDTYQIAVHPTAGITIKTKDANATTVLTIPASTVTANSTQPLPTIIAPTTPTPTPLKRTNISAVCTGGQGQFTSFVTPTSSLPELVLLGKYESSSNHAVTGMTNVNVTKTSPVILVLSSYEPTVWHISTAPGAKVERVILNGYYNQVADVPAGVPVETYVGEQWLGAYAYAWPSASGGSNTALLVSAIESKTGITLGAFGGCYQATAFEVGAVSQ